MERHQLLRDLAHALHAQQPEHITDRVAAAYFLDHLHSGCPRCQRKNCTLARHATCRDCGLSFSITACTPFHGTKISLRHWLLAIWHVAVDQTPISARTFSRRYTLRHQTAWRLLHQVREALPLVVPEAPALDVQVLGFQSKANTAHISVAQDGNSLTAIPDPKPSPPGRPARELPLWVGHLRATIAHVYRGITRRYLAHYLAELVPR